MSPFDLNQVSVIPIEEEQERDQTGCSSASAAPPNFFDQRVADYNRSVHHLQHPVLVQQDQFHHLVSARSQGSDGGRILDLSLCGTGIGGDGGEEEEALPEKMRFMWKMNSARSIPEGSSQIISNSGSNSAGGVVRVCSDCNTTKTPLWRSGPRGPKSLCNACGIRQRKARRAMAAAAMNRGVVIPPSATAYKVRKEKNLGIEIDRTLPFKKRCKVNTTATATATTPATTTAANNKLCSDEALTLSSRAKNSAMMQKVFPPEERDAAILLMTLSCGLIRS